MKVVKVLGWWLCDEGMMIMIGVVVVVKGLWCDG
jgi:hypothetical protein